MLARCYADFELLSKYFHVFVFVFAIGKVNNIKLSLPLCDGLGFRKLYNSITFDFIVAAFSEHCISGVGENHG
jgi:hypothetical protein